MGIRAKHWIAAVLGTALPLLCCCGVARASDHINLEEGMPIQVEDAYPIKYGARELQFQIRYDDPEEGTSRLLFKPELKAGLFLNGHVWIAGNILSNTDDEDSTGEVGVLYNFNTETLSTPAFAVSGKAEFDFDGGIEWTVRGIVTRSVGINRFHLNADYIDAGSPDPGERGSRYRYGLGWSRPLSLDTLLLADVVRTRSRLAGEDAETLIEVGIRYQLSPEVVIVGGLGAGVSGGPDSRNITATAGLSKSF